MIVIFCICMIVCVHIDTIKSVMLHITIVCYQYNVSGLHWHHGLPVLAAIVQRTDIVHTLTLYMGDFTVSTHPRKHQGVTWLNWSTTAHNLILLTGFDLVYNMRKLLHTLLCVGYGSPFNTQNSKLDKLPLIWHHVTREFLGDVWINLKVQCTYTCDEWDLWAILVKRIEFWDMLLTDTI